MRVLSILVIAACGSPPPPPVATPAPSVPTAPLVAPSVPPAVAAVPPPVAHPSLARTDEIVAAKSTACIVAANRKGRWLHRIVADAPPVGVLRIASFADATVDAGLRDDGHRWAAWSDAASELAELGDIDGARLAYKRAEELRSAKRLDRKPPGNRVRLLIGEPVDEAVPFEIQDVPALVHAGKRAKAQEVLAAFEAKAKPDEIRPYQIVPAYVALDLTSKLPALAAQRVSDSLDIHQLWAREAMRQRKGVTEALAALSRARAANPSHDKFVVSDVVAPANALGFSAELAPLRRELRITAENPGPGASLVASTLIELHYAALVAGDREEVARLAPILAKMEPRIADSVPALAAIWSGDLDAALAAVVNYPHEAARPNLYALLWARHVDAGFAPGFEERLAAAACGAK
ncbi:MAG: hypothetical protein SFX73_38370 [Kofleriaceae bacterium]|nr:hypothetical protein [Kofleriaceae bacterium]